MRYHNRYADRFPFSQDWEKGLGDEGRKGRPLLPPQRRARWLANMEAAGIKPDNETIERVDPDIGGRLKMLDELFQRLDFHSSNPDYLRSRTEGEANNGNS